MTDIETSVTQQLFIPNIFAVEPGYLDASAEKERAASIRIAKSGTIQVTLARYQEVRTFMQAELLKNKRRL